ncbi:50S ribosomal protein L29 [Candidatus Woesearchaeota archaeon]|nr:50S ribosomal protein L29 [Candidatus Woesearchaeota archaeon]
MKAVKELVNLKDEALESKLQELDKELMKFRSQVASGTVPRNPGRIRLIKKTIARINTIKSRRVTQRNE